MLEEPLNPNRLLVLDDEKDFGDFVARVGGLAGYDSRALVSPSEFLQALEDWQPSVVVVDLNMPDMDGIEVLREMGTRGSDPHVVLASGIDGRTVESARRLGEEVGLRMAGTFQKPPAMKELRGLFQRLRTRDRAVTAGGLRAAIDQDRLFLLYQPKVDLKTGTVFGVEALVRWQEEDGTVIPPDRFIPLAEEDTELADALTRWVLETALKTVAEWRRQIPTPHLALNMSARNIHDRGLPDFAVRLCRQHGLEPDGVTFELTETASMQDVATLLEVASRFRIKGFHLSIDDFGTGYSSLSQLVRLPFSEIKIDKSFVQEIGHNKEAAVVARAVTDLGHSLGLTVVAEGVETAAVAEWLAGYGTDLAQGFHYARPLADADLLELVGRMGCVGPGQAQSG